MRTHKTFRLPAKLLGGLEERAREAGTTVTALVERYADEGLRRDRHPLIVFREGAAGRRPALAGTRLDVWQVVDTVKSAGSTEAAASYLELPEPHVRACIAYYAEYRDEVDEWCERVLAVAERERQAWEREQAVLT